MKVVEIILLLGSQCISPIEHAPQITVAGKVPCAVLIHRDTEAQSVVVIPTTGSNNPAVRLALARGAGDAATVKSLTSQPADDTPVAEASVITSAKAVPADAVEPVIAVGKQDTLVDDGLPEPSAVVNVEWPPTPDDQAADASPAADGADGESAQADGAVIDESAPEVAEPVTDVKPAAKSKPSKSRTSKSANIATNPKIAQQTRNLKTVCRYPRVAKWYKNKSGKLKYRCVKGGKQGVY